LGKVLFTKQTHSTHRTHGISSGLLNVLQGFIVFRCSISQDLIKETIDGIVSSGLAAVGYKYVNIDDCWSLKEHRNATTGEMIPDPTRFSAGIKALADYAHSKGVKLGIYSDVGFKTCQGYPGSFGYYQIDANTFAKWGVDYLKLDFCYTNKTVTLI
jgi:alpha-galactosidase